MANVGDVLASPESGMQRIDDTNLNISGGTIINTDYSYNNTTRYGMDMTMYVYTSKLILLIADYKNSAKTINIKIDDILVEDNTYNGSVAQYPRGNKVLYQTTLTKAIHKIQLISGGHNIYLDCIDIDEDGYMIYCDDNGKLYYDVTPIMTSNTTPAPYVVSSDYDNINQPSWKAFNGSLIDENDCWIPTKWDDNTGLYLSFNREVKINSLLISNRVNGASTLYYLSLYGSNNDTDYEKIDDFTLDFDASKITKLNNLKKTYKYKTLKILDKYLLIGELRYLLAVETPFYLIQDNADNKIYNYDEENNQLVEITDTSILKEDALKNICIYDLSKVMPLLDTLSDDLTILCNNNKKIIANGLKANKSLVVAKESFSTRLAKNIDFFELVSTISDTSSIKMTVSIDEGVTWKTYDSANGEFVDLTNTCPLKNYADLTTTEKTQWETFRDEVYTNGMDSATLKTIDFNSIKDDNMMFAYIFNRDSYADVCEMSKLQYQFDANGSYTLLNSDSAVNIKQSVDAISVTPKKDIELMKINVGSSGEVNIIQNGGTADIDLPTDEEVDNMINGVIRDVFA